MRGRAHLSTLTRRAENVVVAEDIVRRKESETSSIGCVNALRWQISQQSDVGESFLVALR
jgi:hypothetical protein